MRLLVINPNTSESFTKSIKSVADAVKSSGTEVICINPTSGPRSIESVYDELLSAGPCLELLISNRDRYDGFVIACYGNHPVITAAREMLDQPVVGIMEASLYLACLVGQKFSIITSEERAISMFEDGVRHLGLDSRCASIRSTGTAVLALEGQDRNDVENRIVTESRKAVELDGADVISLGCAGMAGLDERLTCALGVPVVDGVAASIKLLEGLISCGIRTSKRRAYTNLDHKELVDLPEIFSKPYKQVNTD